MFSHQKNESQKAVGWCIQSTKRLSFKNKGEIEILPDKQKPRELLLETCIIRNTFKSSSSWKERNWSVIWVYMKMQRTHVKVIM